MWLICGHNAVICSYGYAGAAAQATIVQPGQTAFVAPTYETYPTAQTAASQYAFAARSQVCVMFSFYCTIDIDIDSFMLRMHQSYVYSMLFH